MFADLVKTGDDHEYGSCAVLIATGADYRRLGVAGEEEADSAQGEAEARRASCASASTAVALAETGVPVRPADVLAPAVRRAGKGATS